MVRPWLIREPGIDTTRRGGELGNHGSSRLGQALCRGEMAGAWHPRGRSLRGERRQGVAVWQTRFLTWAGYMSW